MPIPQSSEEASSSTGLVPVNGTRDAHFVCSNGRAFYVEMGARVHRSFGLCRAGGPGVRLSRVIPVLDLSLVASSCCSRLRPPSGTVISSTAFYLPSHLDYTQCTRPTIEWTLVFPSFLFAIASFTVPPSPMKLLLTRLLYTGIRPIPAGANASSCCC